MPAVFIRKAWRKVYAAYVVKFSRGRVVTLSIIIATISYRYRHLRWLPKKIPESSYIEVHSAVMGG